ncbi:hypothetical protein ACOSQ4_021597 [Xanthoceras sorbifolium]
MTLAEANERIGRLQKIVGEPPSRDVPKLSVMSIEHGEQILYLQQTVADIIKDMEVRFNNVRLEQAGVVDAMTEKMMAMSDEIAILRRVVNSPSGTDEGHVSSKIKVSEPKHFNGSRMPRSWRISYRTLSSTFWLQRFLRENRLASLVCISVVMLSVVAHSVGG